jgi:glutathione S-transferase
MTIRLYDLVLADGAPLSPYVWRTKYALAHKGLAFEVQPVGFTDIKGLFGDPHRTVPIIEDGGRVVSDSWAIADYLEAAYPDTPRLFATPAERSLTRLFDAWFLPAAAVCGFRLVALDIYRLLGAADRPYFRETREQRLGAPLESLEQGRGEREAAFSKALQPLRAVLADRPYLAGAAPGYADYIGWGLLRWVGAVATEPPFAKDDGLAVWVERGFALHGGLGVPRSPRPLFRDS